MTFDPDAAYQVLIARDARFDGRLFVGVTSTGVYCRPICRVRTPLQRNCRFFETPAQAEAASFRPCLKCRPEIAPGAGLPWSVMDASRTLARQAAQELNAQAASGEAASLSALAAKLGVSDRHLRRIFAADQGVTPMQYLQTRRLLLAKQLLTDSALPVAQVALASGFRSLRRFNAAFAQQYRMSPSRLRGAAGDEPDRADATPDAITLTLAYRAPFDHAALLRFVAQRAIPGIEEVDGATIRRTLRAGSVAAQPGWVEARFDPSRGRVQLRFAPALAASSARIVAAARRWLDLDAAPASIDAALADLPGPPGIRLPGSLDAFELAVRAVLGQQVTVAAARTLARRVVERFDTPLATPWPSLARAFPSPQALAEATLDSVASLGIVRTRANALIALAQAWPGLEAAMASPDDFIAALCELPGIGPWTAHYIAMRALGWPDAFPPNDVAVLKAMRLLFGTQNQRDADAQAQAWRPWRAYAVLRLWNSLETPT
ncbi:DNA-3-methyladenine glycosylase 2 family protein [Rhizobacter sp. AJA081-3]|uniref:Ada metal-binding domain-containing protein n=1 Tax=Rhizobacter sp. AJA081-3 TaxID=2753607 RepID=UPI001AE01426|nr:Ada metal-binding domain-containing protein [Rhizobacter sp. AJA081-3]QTN24605.1 DNA-3-methyladenine glycosylase 2 family protein [Rhizobacter sp. AJA081-3]